MTTTHALRTTIGLAAILAAAAGGCSTHSTSKTDAGDPMSPHLNPFVDPFAIASTPEPRPETRAQAPIALNPQPPVPAQPSPAAVSLYGEVMAKSVANPAVPRSGANLSQVSFSTEGADFDPCISADGKQVVFASTQYRETADLFIKSVDSRVVTQLTTDPANDVMPKFSSDGTRIAFASNRSGNWDIYIMPVTGGKAVQVTTSPADDLHPTWSPDGSQIAFCRLGEVSGQWEIWVTDVANTGVARFIGYGLFPEWCPARATGAGGADRIAFQRSRERGDRTFGIWTIDYKDGQAGNITEVASSPTEACINPAWSRDGQWLAYATVPNPSNWARPEGGRPGGADLWLVDLNGNSRISLLNGTAVNLMPTFGPDGRLFFVSDRGGTDNIWAMDTSKAIALATANMKSTGLARSTPTTTPSPATQVAQTPAETHEAPAPTPQPPIATVPENPPAAHDPSDPH